MTTTEPSPTRRTGTLSTALRILTTLTVLNIGCQGASAGKVLMHSHPAFELHETGAIVLHVISGLAMLAAALLWRATRGSIWPTAVTALVFVVSFLQAATGHGRSLYIHVPLAMTLLIAAVWAASWAWLRPVRGALT